MKLKLILNKFIVGNTFTISAPITRLACLHIFVQFKHQHFLLQWKSLDRISAHLCAFWTQTLTAAVKITQQDFCTSLFILNRNTSCCSEHHSTGFQHIVHFEQKHFLLEWTSLDRISAPLCILNTKPVRTSSNEQTSYEFFLFWEVIVLYTWFSISVHERCFRARSACNAFMHSSFPGIRWSVIYFPNCLHTASFSCLLQGLRQTTFGRSISVTEITHAIHIIYEFKWS